MYDDRILKECKEAPGLWPKRENNISEPIESHYICFIEDTIVMHLTFMEEERRRRGSVKKCLERGKGGENNIKDKNYDIMVPFTASTWYMTANRTPSSRSSAG